MSATLASVGSALDEHRGFQRHRCEVPTTCRPPSSWCKDPWPATIRDISNAGINLTLSRRFEKGCGLFIELPTESGDTTTVPARVIHVHSLPQGGWQLGCSFISELSDEELQIVLDLDPVHQATLSEAGLPEVPSASVNDVLFHVRISPHEALRCFVKRLDLCGEWPVSPGKVVALRLGVPGGADPVEMTVRECHKFGSYWVVEARLRGKPTEEVLRVLRHPEA